MGPLAIAGVAAGLGLAAAGAVVWRSVRTLVVPHPYALQPEFEVLAFDADRSVVRLPPPQPRPRQFARTDAEGRFGLLWGEPPPAGRAGAAGRGGRGGRPAEARVAGHGLLGPVVARGDGWLERPLRPTHGSPPTPGAPARLDATLHHRDPGSDLGAPYEELELRGPSGLVAAWWIDRGTRDAVVLVHGRRRARRHDTLRALPPVLERGLSALVTSYRNHDDSDAAPSGLYTYGRDEAHDLLAALAAIRGRGVERVAVVAQSMGCAAALVALDAWSDAHPVLAGLVLEAPLVDLRPVARARARDAGVPGGALAADAGLSLAAWRLGLDWDALDLRRRAPNLRVPVLVIADVLDTTVPLQLVEDFAHRVPEGLLELWRVDGAEHVEAANVAPDEYGRRVGGLLDRAFGRGGPAR